MLRKMQRNEFEQYVNFAYELAMDLSHSGFPVYTDRVKTKEDFVRTSREGTERDEDEILLFEHNGVVEGWVHYFHMSGEKYIGVCSIIIREGFAKALGEVLAYWKEKFPGYSWHMYFPEENKEAVSYLKECGYEDRSQEVVDVLLFEDYLGKPESGDVVEIGKDNFEIFREVHSRYESSMYWTSDRIAASIEKWEIFAYIKDGECKGILYYFGKGAADLEIFGLEAPEGKCSPEAAEKLLVSCLNQAKMSGAKSMYFFNEAPICEITKKLGFKCVTVAHYFEAEMNKV